MNTKYEFVPGDEKVIAPGRTVKRIRALVAIAVFDVIPGELGGYIESEKSLSASGDAWVYGDAWVSGDARVSGNARVYGDAWVSGNAQVYGNAQVSGNAQVYGNAQVSGNARVSGDAWVSGDAHVIWFSHVGSENGTLTVYKTKDSIEVTRGCFRGSIDEFLSASEKKHDDQTHLDYRMLIDVAYSRITRLKD